MARVYEYKQSPAETDLEGARIKAFDPVTRRALVKFWISSLGVIIAAVVLYVLSRRIQLPGSALVVATGVSCIAIAFLLIMNRSLKKMRVLTEAEFKEDHRAGHILEQLDDRFAIFCDVRADESPIEYLVIGPSGLYSVKVSATSARDGWARSGDIEEALEEALVVQGLIDRLVPDSQVSVEPVLCIPAGGTERIAQENKGVWLVPVDKMAVALIKRSGQEGSITSGVKETGAFSSSAMKYVAVERALANHLNIPTRKTQQDYLPPPELTTGP